MSSKLVRKKKNKPKYGWMQSEIDAIVYRDAYDKHVAGYAVTMMQHVLEKNGFVPCGIIYVEDGSPRIAYQTKA